MNRDDVKMRKDKWIPNIRLTFHEDEENSFPHKVSGIINTRSDSWQLEPIKEQITEDQAKAILSIPKCENRGKDRIVWRAAEDGEYTVKAEYHTLKDKEMLGKSKSSSTSYVVEDDVWKVIWELPVPFKVSHSL